MKFTAFALLVSSTQAATALKAAAACHDADVNKAYTAGIKTAALAKTLAEAAIACKTTLAITGTEALDKGKVIEDALWAPSAAKLVATKATAAELTAFYAALDEFGAALGMGKISCAAGQTCASRTLLKGTLAYQQTAMTMATDYFVAQRAFCAKTAATAAACNTAGLKGLKPLGTAFAAADYHLKDTAKRATFYAAEEKRLAAAALAALAPAAGAVGFNCEAAAAVAPATVGVRPACGAANCCMGYKAAAADTVNSAELCQLKTATKGQVTTTAAKAETKSLYVEVTAAVTAEQTGACIEGAVRTASAALSVLAAAYMMA